MMCVTEGCIANTGSWRLPFCPKCWRKIPKNELGDRLHAAWAALKK